MTGATTPAVRKAIVTCAVTGSIHVPSQSPFLPITPDEIAAAAIGAAEAGAAIVHLHARDPGDGRPDPSPELFAQFLPRISERVDAIVNLSTGGAHTMSAEERLSAARRFQPELCSLNMGSMNFGLYPMAAGVESFRFDWERQYLEGSRDDIFKNTFADIETIVREMSAYGTRFEFECYDVGHLYTLAHFLDAGLVEPPLFVQTIFGILGGIGPEVTDLVHMRETANRLFGSEYVWSILGGGRHQTRLVTVGAIMGGSVRVGLEDSLYLGRGELARTNADQVEKVIRILGELSIEVASPAEARAALGLKGGNNVAF